MIKKLISLIFLLTFSSVLASEVTVRSDITLEVTQFEDDGDSDTFENQRSIKLHVEGEKEWSTIEAKFAVNARFDDQDSERNILWFGDTYLINPISDKLELRAGFQVFNFSYMEAFHPLDSLNARIIDVSLVNSEKMGEPFISLQTYKWDADIKFILLPYAIRPVLPGKNSRLNLPQDFNKARWVGQDGKEPDISNHFAVSFEKTFDSYDILALVSKGIDRSRLLIGTIDYTVFGDTPFPDSADFFTPFYFERYLTGVNGVYNFESFQLKGSLAHTYYLSDDEILVVKSGTESNPEFELVKPQDYTAMALGFEKPLSHSGGFDSTIIVEYQNILTSEKQRFPIQNDLFAAWRFSFNDINSKQVTLSILQDLESTDLAGYMGVAYSQRFLETWKIELGALTYFIPDDAPLNGLGFFRDKGNVNLKVQRFF